MFWKKKTTENDIRRLVQGLHGPYAKIESVLFERGHVLVTLAVDPSRGTALEEMRQQIMEQLAILNGVCSVQVVLTAERQTPASTPVKNALPDLSRIKKIIAVASGKGGVGKSTVAANLAVALAQQDYRVGLLDADIYGPSIPMLFGVRGQKPAQDNDKIVPLQAHGVTLMSMGLMVDEQAPMVWRGPMVQSALLQMLRDVAWGDLDMLLIDMPPGTGDTQLTIAQKVKLAGAVIVSTPQDVALLDTVKGVEMFRKVNVPILGVVENMSLFCCPNCNHQSDIFGAGGAERRAAALNVPFLGALPLDPAVRMASDAGTPLVGEGFQQIASSVAAALYKSDTNIGRTRFVIE